ncbi:MAG: KamA family radical SAM protein, partial [Gammaproteobacteria bacterium]|nr:KamA family radical SAM protein [Gammaproteobacteria bacterium]
MRRMIPRNAQTWQGQRPSWQQQLTDSVRQAQDLLNILGLENLDVPNIKQFPMRVPMDFVMRMEKNNANDPLLRQVLPLDAEKQIHPGFSIDPVGDQAASPHQGIIHKYQGRLLLTLTGACAVHCRYCFRRHYPYSTSNPIKNQWLQTLNYIRLHQDLHEVILSGGDPLMLSDEQLADIIRDIANIPHIRHLRIHSRLPIVLPARITHTLCQILEQSSLT